MKRLRYFILLIILSKLLSAQNSGEAVYEFASIPNAAHVAALGENYSLAGEDLAFAYANPALLSPVHNEKFFCSWANIGSSGLGINMGHASYAFSKGNYMFACGTHFINYGKFEQYSELGSYQGNFTAGDYLFFGTAAIKITDKISAGATLKPVYSSYESYNSFGMLCDLGIAYIDEESLFSAGLVLKNAGAQITTYTEGNREDVPWKLNASVSKKLQHAPFRLHITYHDIQKFRLDYESSSDDSYTLLNDDEEEEETWIEDVSDNLLRHFVIGVELLFGKKFYGAVSYDIQRRKELSLEEGSGLTGMAIGFGLKMKRFDLSYARYVYNPSGASNYLSLQTDLGSFYDRFKKKK